MLNEEPELKLIRFFKDDYLIAKIQMYREAITVN